MKPIKALFIAFSVLILAACNSYKIEVDLEDGRAEELRTNIKEYQEIIDNYDYSDGTIPWEAIINMANAYDELGEVGKAIDVYEDVINDGGKTKAILNNLGRLYEKAERYDDAVVMYQRINDEYFDRDYLKDITWAYIRAGERKLAEKYFNAWQLEFQTTDESIQQAIKALRAQEQAEAQ